MNKNNFKKINWFELSNIGVGILVICFVFFISYRYEKNKGEKQITQDGPPLCTLITDMVQGNLFPENGNKNLNLLDYVIREKEIAYCIITDKDQKPLLQLGQKSITPDSVIEKNSWNSKYLLSQKYMEKESGDMIYEFSKPIYQRGNKVALVRIGLALSNYVHTKRSMAYIIAPIALSILCLVLLCNYLLKRLLAPLYHINQDLVDMLEKETAYPKMEISFKGEMGQLAQRMNQLLLVQYEKNKELEELNTEEEVANKILHYKKNRMKTILDNLKVGVVLIDSNGKGILGNHSAERLLRVEKDSYLDKSWDSFLAGYNKELQEMFQRMRQKQNIYSSDYLEIKDTRDNASLELAHECNYLLDEKDKPIGFLWTIVDITTEKNAETSRHEFINHVAHELKTPLTTLRSYSEMLLDDEVSDEETKREFFNSINNETIRLTRLINNLLKISMLEMGSLNLNQTMIKTGNLVSDCYQTVQPQAASKKIDFIFDVSDKMPNLKLDKDLIEVAILNLLTNAIKYTPESGKVVFTGSAKEKELVITVSDTGMGIAESEIPYIFDEFFRSSRDEIKKVSGTGLGLTLAMDIVRLHKGDISVESKEGIGSTFTLTLPREEVFI